MSSFPETGLFPFNLSRADVSKTTPSTIYTVNEEPSANGIMNQGQPHDDKNPSENTTATDESLTEPMTYEVIGPIDGYIRNPVELMSLLHMITSRMSKCTMMVQCP